METERLCPECGREYGKKRRCFFCNGRPKTGSMRTCGNCGSEFYAAAWKINDTKRGQGKYCSDKCRIDARIGQPTAKAHANEKKPHPGGYLLVYAPDHPNAHRGRVLEHRLVMEKAIGRYLLPDEVVHHKDRNKHNNKIDNLELRTNSDHAKEHAVDNLHCQSHKIEIHCLECGASRWVPPSKVHAPNPKNIRKYCSRSCRAIAVARRKREMLSTRRI